jgi:hypothetical protein
MSDKTSDTGILDVRFPGYAWMPRWTRKYWTPSVAGSLVVFLFSAGVWWGTYKTAPDMQGLRKDLAPLISATSSECVRGCLLTKEDISTLESHVKDLWDWKKGIDAEGQLTIKPIPPPQPVEPTTKRRGSTPR